MKTQAVCAVIFLILHADLNSEKSVRFIYIIHTKLRKTVDGVPFNLCKLIEKI